MPDELDLLRAFRVEDAIADPVAHARVRAAVLARATASAPRTPPPRRRRRRSAVAAIAGVAAVAIIVALATGLNDANVTPPPATAAEALKRVASAAEVRPTGVLAPGEFLYLRERTRYGRPPALRETWTGYDGQGSFRVLSEGGAFPGRRDSEGWTSQSTGGDGFFVGQEKLSYDELAALPTDPRRLHDRLVRAAGDAGPSPEGEAFVIVGDMLRTLPVPTDVRAALFRATALIDGIQLVGPVTDPLGRSGIAIGHPEVGQQLVFDPDTAVVLDERSKNGTFERVVEEQAIVSGPRARPGSRPDAPPIPPKRG